MLATTFDQKVSCLIKVHDRHMDLIVNTLQTKSNTSLWRAGSVTKGKRRSMSWGIASNAACLVYVCYDVTGVGKGKGMDEEEAILCLQSLLHPSATPAIQAWQQARYTPPTSAVLASTPIPPPSQATTSQT